MPVYEVEDDQGNTLELEGDSPPSEQELEQIFSQFQATTPATPEPAEPQQLVDQNESVEETVLPPFVAELASAANRGIAEVVDFFGPGAINAMLSVAGSESRVPTALGAIKSLPGGEGGFMEPGLARDVTQAAGETAPLALSAGQVFRSAASKLPAFTPAESTGRGVARQLGQSTAQQDVAAGVLSGAGAEVGEDLGGEEGRLAGSIVAPLAGAVPAALVGSQQITKLLKAASPSVEKLRGAATSLYRQIDDSGVRIANDAYSKLSNAIASKAKASGFNEKIQPKISGVLDEIAKVADSDQISVGDITTLRRVARTATRSLEPDERRRAAQIIDDLDEFLINPPEGALLNAEGNNVGKTLQQANQLWSRLSRSESIERVITSAGDQASGLENGIRIGLRALIKSAQKPGGREKFSKSEIDLMRKVVRGTTASNTAKLLGKLGYDGNQAANMLLPGLGIAAGASVGGPLGAGASFVVGTASRKAAEKLTLHNAKLAQTLIRAGADGRKVAAAYLRSVPKKERNLEDLTSLLLNQKVKDLGSVEQLANPLAARAGFVASVIVQTGQAEPAEENEPANQ